MVIDSPYYSVYEELASPEQTATGCLLSPELEVAVRDVAASFDSAVHRVHAVSLDAAVASTVSAACCVAAGYIVSAGLYCCCLLCSCCFSILFLREDLSRNLELTESKPSLGEDFVPAGSSSSIPADYVSADSIMSFLLAVQVAFLLIMFLLVMFSFMLTEIESADC
ncbi:hypothetical protein Tco_1004472 [Tanacetum coccineum]|uniref:Uncharacterized protein n=1 Tax=Tanacetum coccineum TaxID=301880 RepID=A0ABQ5FCZ8_9ASTR